MGDKLVLETSEGDKHVVDMRIKYMSGLIDKICQDYSTEQEIKLEISSEELNSVIEFFKILDYKPLEIKRPMIDLGNIYDKYIKCDGGLLEIYDSLTSDDIIKYFKIADYLDLLSLENVLYLKLLCAFENHDKTSDLFDSVSSDIFKMTKEQELELKKKYIQYCRDYTNNLTDEQLNDLLDELNNAS
jgi:hypothetical protein